jgi:transcriptional regulator with XRE-family HTH domain
LNIKEIGDIIKFHRQKSGMTQLELADLAGLGKTVIFDIEKGKTSIKSIRISLRMKTSQ